MFYQIIMAYIKLSWFYIYNNLSGHQSPMSYFIIINVWTMSAVILLQLASKHPLFMVMLRFAMQSSA